MIIHTVKITNFKSCYGTYEFNFDTLTGLVKLSGPIGSGKTLLVEALQWGLLGNVKGQPNTSLVSWNMNSCEVEIQLSSNNKEVYIKRSLWDPLVVEIDGKSLIASNKRNMQTILEEDIYDIPKLAIIKMCLISFNGFSTLADMNPGQTKEFIDEIFGFKLFSQYTSALQEEKKQIQNNIIKLTAMHEDNIQQISRLEEKKRQQQIQIGADFNVEALLKDRELLVNEGLKLKNEKTDIDNLYINKEKIIEEERLIYYKQKTEYAALGKQEKNFINTFKNGTCPTCGNIVNPSLIDEHKSKMLEYAEQYKLEEIKELEVKEKLDKIKKEHSEKIYNIDQKISDLKSKIRKIDSDITIHNNNIKLINDNYDELIKTHSEKVASIKEDLSKCDNEIKEWSELEELLSKTLRYRLLNTLIPHINKSINFFMNRLEQPYRVEFDQEFKAHIYTESVDREISYGNLSTGQKKTVDIAIVFGILQNIISNVDMNVIILDELMSNMDSDARNVMLSVLKDSLGNDKCIFVVNHAEMNDDYFDHKIRVGLINKKVTTQPKKKEQPKTVVVRASQYEQIF